MDPLAAPGSLLALAVLGARIGTALLMFPLFAAATLPLSVRGSLVAALALCLLPVVGAAQWGAWAQLDGVRLTLLLVKEVGLGLALGLVGSAAFWAVHAAGSVIESQAGLTAATVVDPLAGQEDSLVGGFLMQVLCVLFLAAGGLLALLGVFYESYRVWPVGAWGPTFESGLWLRAGQATLAYLMDLALRVAAPFVLLMLLVEAALGLLGRHAPSLNVFFLALPIKAAVLLALLLVYTWVISDVSPVADLLGPLRLLLRG